ERAEDILLSEREINIALLEMETGMRGYVIVNNEAFLKPYNAAVTRLPALWTTISNSLDNIDNIDSSVRTQLQTEAANYKTAADRWQHEWGDLVIAYQREGSNDQAISNISKLIGKDLFDTFRQAGESLNATITKQINAYGDNVNKIRWIEMAVILVLALLTISGAIITMGTARYELRLEMEATRRIENEHQQLRAVVNNLPVAVRVAGAPESNVILQNHQAEEIFPAALWNTMTRGERIKYFDLRTPDGEPIDADHAPIATTISAGQTAKDVELLTSRPETGTRHIMVSAAPIKNSNGAVTSSVLVMRDVTQLKAIDHRKDEFIAIAAHELRNPLAALVGYNHLAQRTLSKVKSGMTPTDEALPAIERHLGEMNKQIERLTKLITRLLDASRITLGKITIEKSPTDLVKIAEEAVANAQTTDAGQHQIELSTPTDLSGQWDPTRIEQVITNLLDNALRYSPPNTAVKLSVTQEADKARVEVTDQGPGISDYQRTHLFNRYYGPIPLQLTPENSQAPRSKRG
ncbi:MAG: CHASE3 domain-containing protein, partial [Chloroflexia bacterium]